MNRQTSTAQSITFFVFVSSLLFSSISACASLPAPTTTPAISRDEAIEIAISGCKTPHLVLVGQPENIRAKLLSLEEADKLTSVDRETTSYGIPMDTSVWLVQMDGQLQLVGGPAPVVAEGGQAATPTPPQPNWGTCIVIVNASSGDLILVRG
jgi:hypothetical protein